MTGFRMRLNGATDQDIVQWLQAQTDKTLAVKRAIRIAMRDQGAEQESDAPEIDLSAIRKVIETALDERLQRVTIGTAQEQPSGDPITDAKIDSMF